MSMFFKCPSCKETGRVINGELKCFSCGWDKRKIAPTFRKLTENEEREEREKKVREMTTRLISESPPRLLFTEGDLKSVNASLGNDWGCWAWAHSSTNSLRISNYYPEFDAYNLHRRQFTNTVVHETAHLSPKRAMDWEDFLNKCKESDWSWKQLQDWVEEHPDKVRHLNSGFPNNCVPNEFNKESFVGYENYWSYTDGRGIEFVKDDNSNWEAGTGHGWGWLGEYGNYKGQLYGSYENWMNDERQFNKLSEDFFEWPTFSNGWFRKHPNPIYRNKEVIMKSRQDIDLYGEEFYSDEDDDLYGMIRKR